jgi:glycosyltransferase involved in cell wall biosynthesis
MVLANPEITVVMATYNRADIIPHTLGHLARQTLSADRFEVIICDDGSKDNTEEVVRSLSSGFPFRTSYLKHPNSGCGYTQNRGILAAAAPIVCLIADDILLAPQTLETFLNGHLLYPEQNVAILGTVLQSPELKTKSVFLSKWDPFKFRTLKNKKELPYYLFWACNISFKKDFMIRYGMFRTEMGPGGAANHEDVEVGYRLFLNGMKLYYNRDALGYHHHIDTFVGSCRRAYQRGLNWHGFRALVDDPAVTVQYHIFNKNTLADHIRAFSKKNIRVRIDTNPIFLLALYVARSILFNTLTVLYFWQPIINLSEKNRLVAKVMHTQIYRGVINYHFQIGINEGRNLKLNNSGRPN